MKHCQIVLGNSSSGLIEAPSFKMPTVNIGDRQKGRLLADSVISCDANSESIIKAIELGLSNEFQVKLESTINPYGEGNPSQQIVSTILKTSTRGILKKTFNNII
jgi:UDP-N-acetylglucosamine 2-epimerase